MAILYIEQDRWRLTRRRAAWGAGALALGAMLGAAFSGGSVATADPAPVVAADGARAMRRPHDALLTSHDRPPLQAAARPAGAVPLPDTDAVAAADAAYQQALLYDDCRRSAALDALGGRDHLEALYERDPTGALAAAQDRADRAHDAQCQQVGPQELQQIDLLMRQAAAAGNRDAKFFLLQQDARAELAQTDAAAQDPALAAPAVSAALVGEVEAMARTGDRAAIELALDIANAAAHPAADPVHAAAWRLVLLQLDGGSLPSDDDLALRGVLFGLDADAAQRARHEAAALHAACCQAR